MPRSYLACLNVVVEKDTCEVANPTEGVRCDIMGLFVTMGSYKRTRPTQLLGRYDPEGHGSTKHTK